MMNHSTQWQHTTVLLNEAVESLRVKSDGVYVDGTFGRGGHSRLILSQLGSKGRLIVFDKDPEAIQVANDLAKCDNRVIVIHQGFAQIQVALGEVGVDCVDGLLFDLGISSPQVDNPDRGFSFQQNAPLDMRMDPSRGMSAADWLSVVDEVELERVIREYGEERFSRQIAKTIVASRQQTPISTTHQLASIVASVVRTREKGKNPATRAFQAIRIHINNELEEIVQMLPQAASLLREKGRLAVISFHSLEDRLVKQFMRKYSRLQELPRWVMIRENERGIAPLTLVGRAIKASESEILMNPRARSAVLRVAERTAGDFIHE